MKNEYKITYHLLGAEKQLVVIMTGKSPLSVLTRFQRHCKFQNLKDMVYVDKVEFLQGDNPQSYPPTEEAKSNTIEVGPDCPWPDDCFDAPDECSSCGHSDGKHHLECPDNHSPFSELIRFGYD